MDLLDGPKDGFYPIQIRPHPINECLEYDTKPSDGEDLVFELWGM